MGSGAGVSSPLLCPVPHPFPASGRSTLIPAVPSLPALGAPLTPLPSSVSALPQLALRVKAGCPLLQRLAFGKATVLQNRRKRKVCASNQVLRSCMRAQTRDGPAKAATEL